MKVDRAIWPRVVAHVDMMCFFASVEQRDFPDLANQPVAVVNGEKGSTIIAASYQAKAFGIGVGTKVKEALAICPQLVIRQARPSRYAQISQQVMHALETIAPDLEVYSVDECWLELTPILHHYHSIEAIAVAIQAAVLQATGGLPCSIGISEGKLTAKFCSELNKGGVMIISPADIAMVIGRAKVSAICGIGKNITRYLNQLGVYYCHDLQQMPVTILSDRFGHVGRRLYYTCLGHDPEPLARPQAPKSLGHGKVLPPNTQNLALVTATLMLLCERLSARLRRCHLQARVLFVGLRFRHDWLYEKVVLHSPTAASKVIWQIAKQVLQRWDQKTGVFRLQVTAMDLFDSQVQQLSLFVDENKDDRVDALKDQVNHKFGRYTLVPASATLQLNRHFEVIAPAWRPDGPRKSI